MFLKPQVKIRLVKLSLIQKTLKSNDVYNLRKWTQQIHKVLCMCSHVLIGIKIMPYQVSSSLQQHVCHISVSILTGIRQCCVTRCRGGMDICSLMEKKGKFSVGKQENLRNF